ncbi:MAG: carbohydrate binding family 9 domain-containing protein [Bacteroidales bacterium]|nr:carbohydrate binding family 9 domain-containing protein [Bacteroidales bacterium]
MRRLLLLVAISGFFTPSFARQDTVYPKKIYTPAEVQVPPVVDGWITDEAWEKVPWAEEFQMHDPYDDRPASQVTRFKLVIDRENIYVAFRAFDTAPDSIVKRLTRRDDMDGDMVAILFDSYHDLQSAFGFVASAAGSKVDFYMSNDGQSEDITWNPIWWVETQIDDQGWTMEAKIPFSQLRFDRSSGGVWGFQVARVIFRNNETSFWQPISKESPGFVHLMGELHGLENIDPKKQAEITPYAVAGSDWFEKEPEDPYRAEGYDRSINGGLDAKIGLTNNFTLDMTVNPDFGQVEADPSEVNLTAYETFFQEQRPFFIEGKNIFDYDLAVHTMNNLFYSRRIGRRPHHYPDLASGEYANVPQFTNILGAAKITGKTKNGLSVGIMESITSGEQAEIDNNGDIRYETVEPLTNYFASRVSKEFQKGNTILGGMITSTNRFNDEQHLDYLHSSAISGGIDFQQYFADRSYVLSFSTYMSQVRGTEEALIRTQRSPVHYFQRPDAEYLTLDSTRISLSGYGGSLQFAKQSGKFTFGTFINFNSPGLELNDIGFLNSTDEILEVFYAGYRFNEPFSIFRSMSLNINQFSVWDFGGNHQIMGGNFNGHAQLKNLWNAGFSANVSSEVKANAPLRGGPSMILPGDLRLSGFVSTSSNKKLTAMMNTRYSEGFENSGTSISIDFGLTYKPISNLSFSLDPNFSLRREELQYVTQQHFDGEQRYIFGSIDQKILSISLRVDLILTPELTLQFWGQPFIASGDYSNFKYISDPAAESFTERFHTYTSGEIEYIEADDIYRINEPVSSLDYEFGNPDFNVKEFLSNLVFRWEYRPGSFIYLVWSQTRSGYNPFGQFRFRDDFADLWDIHPTDAIILKVSYRIGR